MEAQEFFTWAMLATYGGATLATTMLTQALKEYIPMKTQLLSMIISFIVLLAASFFTTGLTASKAMLCIINAVVVSFASNGAYEAAIINKKNDCDY